jgi:WD40 repeat protein
MTAGESVLDQPIAGKHSHIDAQNPWPGLGAFDEEAQRFFNGRRHEAAELRRLVLHAPLTVVFGASGLGKTSLLQAGLFPLLRKENILPVYIRLDVRDRRAALIDQVKNAMVAQLKARHVDAPAFSAAESLWEWLHRDRLELWSDRNHLLTPLFVFDQFEEVFTLGAESPEAIAHLRVDLADLIENRIPDTLAGHIRASEAADAGLSLNSQCYKVLISFREDFLPAVEGWKRDLPSIMRNRLRLLQMSGEQAFEAVHSTAPHLADEAIARKIIRFVAAAQEEGPALAPGDAGSEKDLAVEPALLSLVCHGLNERRKAQGKSAFDLALLNGTGQAIVSDYYRDAVADLPARVQRFIENELITERGFRKPCDLGDAHTVHSVSEQDLRLLVDRRLLRIEPHRGIERVELTHDLLTGVVREHRGWQRERERARRQRRRVGMFAALGVVLFGFVLVLGFLYTRADRLARIETIKRLISQANIEFGISPTRGLLLAGEALNASSEELACGRQVPCVQFAAEALIYWLSRTGGTPLLVGEKVQALSFSQDGNLLAAGGERSVSVWRVKQRGAPIMVQPIGDFPGGSGSLSFSPDGKLLAVAAFGSVNLFRLDEPATQLPETIVIASLENMGDATSSVSFSKDGKLLLMASGVRSASLRELVDLDKPIFEWGSTSAVRFASFTPDGIVTIDHAGSVWEWRFDQLNSTGKPRFVVAMKVGALKGGFEALSFSADGGRLLIPSRLNTARFQTTARFVDLKDVASFDESSESSGEARVTRAAALSPDGTLAAIGDDGGTVRVWRTGAINLPPIELHGHEGTVYAAAFTADANFVATGGGDGIARIWRIDQPVAIAKDQQSWESWSTRLDELIGLAGETAGRNFTRDEWSKFFSDEEYRLTFPNLPPAPKVK